MLKSQTANEVLVIENVPKDWSFVPKGEGGSCKVRAVCLLDMILDSPRNKIFVSKTGQLCEIVADCSTREVLKCIERHSWVSRLVCGLLITPACFKILAQQCSPSLVRSTEQQYLPSLAASVKRWQTTIRDQFFFFFHQSVNPGTFW